MKPSLGTGLAGIGMLWLTVGCTTWMPIATESLKPQQVEPVRIVLAGGAQVAMVEPSVSADSLVGISPETRQRLAIPLTNVQSVSVRQTDPVLSTVAAVVGGGATLLLISAMAGDKAPPAYKRSSGGEYGCPFVYSWDGVQWRLDSGTFGGAITPGLQRTDVDNLIYARATVDGLRLRVADAMDETDHVDALEVVAIDHAAGLTVVPDPVGGLHTIAPDVTPVHAVDFAGSDVLPRVRSADDWSWESRFMQRDTARADAVRDGIEVSFVRPADATQARLVFDGRNTAWAVSMLGTFIAAHGAGTKAWYDSLDTNPALAVATQSLLAREAFLRASVWDGAGWVTQGLFWESGPEISKRQVMQLDLSAVHGDTVRVRLESAPSFWLIDRVAIEFTVDQPVTEHRLRLRTAVDQRGRDVRALIATSDHVYYTLERGDHADLVYDLPAPPPAGQVREFVLRSTGWYRPHLDPHGAPDAALLRQVAFAPLGVSKAAVTFLNAALTSLEAR